MKKVITYGTFDLLHYGHVKLLQRAKALGDYLVVGVTSEDFDRSRGKINVQQSLIERIKAIQALNIADEIIVEEYEGQKIDDIKRYAIDIFTVGSDWVGTFDYLKKYCQVIYLERTEGISSSEIRQNNNLLKIGIVGDSLFLEKFVDESIFVNGVIVVGICTDKIEIYSKRINSFEYVTNDYDALLDNVDAVYIHSRPLLHYEQIKKALLKGKHVLCESPISLSKNQAVELFELANKLGLVLQTSIKTAHYVAYERMLGLIKSGVIGKVVSVDSTCTSLSTDSAGWNSIFSWGSTALLPIFDILGVDYKDAQIVSAFRDAKKEQDIFTKIDFIYSDSVASIKVAKNIKSEGELVVSGTRGYIYIPSPWWKTSYFEIRFENFSDNKKYFYQLDGEGIRYEIAHFNNSIAGITNKEYVEQSISCSISKIMEDFVNKKQLKEIVVGD